MAEIKGLPEQASAELEEGAGQLGGGVAEKVARAGFPRLAAAAGVVAGAAPTITSAAYKELAGFVPTTVKDFALIAGLEGAGALAKAYPAAAAALRVGTGAVVGGGIAAVASGEDVKKTLEGAAVGGLTAGLAPKVVRQLVAETPLTEMRQRAIASAKELNIPAFLDEVADTPVGRWLGDRLRSDPTTLPTMQQADAGRVDALVKAKTDLLDSLGPGGTPEALGAAVKQEAGKKLEANAAGRLQEYSGQRAAMTNPFPAPALPEARGAAVEQALAKNQADYKAVRGGLYDYADSLLSDHPDNLRVPAAELHNQAQEVLAETGSTKAGRDSAAYKISSDITTPTPADPAAANVVKDFLDTAVRQSKEKLSHLSEEGVDRLTGGQISPDILPPEVRDAYLNRGLQALRDAHGDVGALEARPDLAAKLPPQVQAALRQTTENKGTVSLSQLNEHISNLGEAADKERFGSGDYNPTGRQLLRLEVAAKTMRADFFATQNPDAAAAQQLADVFHADYANTFRTKQVQAIYNSDPIGVFQKIIRTGDVDALGTLAKAVGPIGAPVLKRQLFDMAFGDGSKIPSEAELTKNLATLGPAIRTLFSPMEQSGLRAFAKTGDLPQFLQSAYEAKLREVADRDPQAMVSTLMRGEGDTLLARSIKRYVSPDTFNRLGRMIMDGILTPAAAMPERGASGIVARLHGYSARFLDTFYDPAVIRQAARIGDASQLLPGYNDLAKVPGGAPGAALHQAGLMISPRVLAGGVVRGAVGDVAMFAVGKEKLIDMYTTPAGQKWLTTALRLPAYDPRWGDLLRRGISAGYLQINSALKPGKPSTTNAQTP